jgi:hypothetical protein
VHGRVTDDEEDGKSAVGIRQKTGGRDAVPIGAEVNGILRGRGPVDAKEEPRQAE